MRVIFAAEPHLPTTGGAQLTTHWLAREMLRGGHYVTVLAAQLPGGLGRVVPAAQASGIPAIARGVGGLPEAVGEGGLVLAADAGATEWAAALSSLWDDEARYARWSARAVAEAKRGRLSAAAVGDRFEALLREVASHAG